MKVRIEGRSVDVADKLCAKRDCFQLGFDQGTFVAGRGYTSYHKGGPRAVCMRRHMNGCPCPLICLPCRSLHVSLEVRCRNCGGPLSPYQEPSG